MKNSDWQSYCEYALDPKVMRYICPIESIDIIREHFDGYAQDWDAKEGHWMGLSVVLQQSKKMIGDVGFRYKSKEHQQIEIGYKFNRKYHGQGYGSEAVDALVSYIYEHWDFHKLVAYCDPRNIASFKLMERYGMKREGHFKEHFNFGDGWQDELAYGVLKRDIKLP